jgi:hypothetical protein
VRFEITGAREGTFVAGEMGMDPRGLVGTVFDAVAGRRYFSGWISATLDALERVAAQRSGPP